MPRDPKRTFNNVQEGVLRVGVTENPPWTEFDKDRPTGMEVTLLEQFAKVLDSRVDWRRGSEEKLFTALKNHELDIVIGGFTASTPWSKQVGLSQPYITFADQKHVMALPPGENRWILEVDKYLQKQKGRIQLLDSTP